jgi:hypothetical protein
MPLKDYLQAALAGLKYKGLLLWLKSDLVFGVEGMLKA